MKNKSFIGALFAAGLCGLMLTACGKKNDTADGVNNGAGKVTTSRTDNKGTNGTVDTSGANQVHGDNPGRSRDVDGDGFVEDVVNDAKDIVDDAARGVGNAAQDVGNAVHDVGNAVHDVGNAARDVGNAARNVVDDLSPGEHDRSTVTTTHS